MKLTKEQVERFRDFARLCYEIGKEDKAIDQHTGDGLSQTTADKIVEMVSKSFEQNVTGIKITQIVAGIVNSLVTDDNEIAKRKFLEYYNQSKSCDPYVMVDKYVGWLEQEDK